MKKLLIGGLFLGLASATLAVPGTIKVHTNPRVPSREALDRMGLTLAWQARILLHGDRDGFFSVQLLPGPRHPQLLVQSYSGLVALFDGETGDQLWKTQVGLPYALSLPVGYNANSIFVTRRNVVFVMNRATGLHRLFDVDKFTGVHTNGVELPYTPTAAPVAEDGAVFFVMSTRTLAFLVPTVDELDKLDKAGQSTPSVPAETFEHPFWTYPIGEESVQYPALLAGNQLSVVTVSGSLVSLSKVDSHVRHEFDAEAKVVAQPGQHGVMAYLGTERATLFAYNMDSDKLAWRFFPGGPVRVQPAVTDRDVFVASDTIGLYRVRRDNGREVWLAKQMDRFLATNDKFAYALHHSGELHVLDYLRGSSMAHYDMKDWTIPVANELTDRIYFASNDGQLICLRHRDLRVPLANRALPVPQPKKEEKKDDKKKEEPKEDKEKAAASLDLGRPAPRSALDALPMAPATVSAALPLSGRGRWRFAP
jgi:outer membrane protein assembly factor BamB